jgi:tetratricopeptide (TPR) repeat protein
MAGYDMTMLEDRTNLLGFLQNCAKYCLVQSNESDRAFKLLFQIWEKASGKLWFLGYWNDYFRCGNIVLKSARAVNNVEVQAQLLSELGWACMEWEEFATAQKFFHESLQNYQSLQDDLKQCRLLRYLGVLSHRQEQLNSALEYFRKAWHIVKANSTKVYVDDKWAFYEAELPNVIGCVYLDLQEFYESYHELHLSLENYHALLENYPNLKTRYRYYQADPLLNLGRWHFLQGDYEQARQYYQECIQLSTEINRTDTMADGLLRLAEIAETEGNEEEAVNLASEAERVAGTEITSIRDRAARFKEKVLAKK